MFEISEARRRLRSAIVFVLCVGILVMVAGAANGQVPGWDKMTPGFIDDDFRPVIGGLTGTGNRTIAQPDGKILVVGNFQLANGVNKNGVARYNADGTLDATFNARSGANAAVNAIGLQSTGKIIVVGLFTMYAGQPVGFIARLNPDGSFDGTFNNGGILSTQGAGGTISEVSVLPDDKIYIAGSFTTYNGATANRLARLHPNGGLDTTFAVGVGPSSGPSVIEQAPDGKILISGFFTTYNTLPAPRLARINSDGSLDATFGVGSGPNNAPRVIDVLPDNKILITGIASYNGTNKAAIARLNPDGTLDPSFDVAGIVAANAVVSAMARQADGKLIVGGNFTSISGTLRGGIARLSADGAIDTTFDPGAGLNAASIVNGMALQSDGKVVLTGNFTSYNGTSRQALARVNNDGSLDSGMSSGLTGLGSVLAIARHTDGKIYVGGGLVSVNGSSRPTIARLNPDGSTDLTFNPGTGANQNVAAIGVQADGKAIISGNFTQYNGTPINRIARLNLDGTLDMSFNVGSGLPDPGAQTIVQQPDGKILVGGLFTTYNGTTVTRLIRLNSDGSLDATFNNANGPNNMVFKVVVQADGKIVICGDFLTVSGAAKRGVARLNADGTNDPTFDQNGTGFVGRVTDVTVDGDGKIVAVGGFTTFNGTGRVRVARINVNGSLDTSFDPGVGFPNELQAISPTSDGKYIVAGNFTTAAGLPRNKVARLRSNGSVDPKFISGLGPAGAGNILRQIVPHNGRYLIAGQFDAFNTSARTGLVSISNATKAPVDFDGDGKTDIAIMRHYGGIGPMTFWIKFSTNESHTSFDFGTFTVDAMRPGDYDGDGVTDVALWRGVAGGGFPLGYWMILSSTNSVKFIPFGSPGDVTLAEDWDGDGKDDMSVWRAPLTVEGQATFIYRGSFNNPNGNLVYTPYGIRYGTQADQVDEPYPGDFDGDGRTDFRVQRRLDTTVGTLSTPAIWYTTTQAGQTSIDYFGWAGDRTIPGDYDGDGKTDMTIARGFNSVPSITTWYMRSTGGAADSSFQWGAGALDQFAQGDYDGDGITDPTVYRRAGENNFYILRSSDHMMQVVHWGKGDEPCGPACDIAVATYNNR